MKLIINQEQSLRSSYLWAQMGTVLRLSFRKFVEGGQYLNLKTLGATYSIIIKYFKVGMWINQLAYFILWRNC